MPVSFLTEQQRIQLWFSETLQHHFRWRLRISRFPHSAVSRGVRLPFVGRDLLGELFEPLMTKSEARVCRRMGILVPDRGIIW